MSDRRTFLHTLSLAGAGALVAGAGRGEGTPGASTPAETRAYWLEVLLRISGPVIDHLAEGRLRAEMPVEEKPGRPRHRAGVTHLEAFGRTVAGMAPWLALASVGGEEGRRRDVYVRRTQAALAHAVDPASPDFMNFTEGGQPLVDAAFLAHAMLRAPDVLWFDLPARTRAHLADALRATRVITPPYNNWLLFSAMVEAALLRVGEEWDRLRLDLALRKVDEWYVGDGHYSDGPEFHWDYYNSFVIQPFLLDLYRTIVETGAWPGQRSEERFERHLARQVEIGQRYGAIQERLIAPDGTFPPIGRSITYRFGAFQLLAQLALWERLPEGLSPGQVRSALTAVIRRVMVADDLFDEAGWLRLGLYGHQPDLAEGYISTGSLYLTTTGLLPLGLAPTAGFWSEPDQPWTQVRIWRGDDLPADAALKS